MTVANNTVVALRYCMKNGDGDVLENILHAAPVEYLHGGGSIMPALEAGLAGLEAGAVKKISISGEHDVQLPGSFYFDVVIDSVRAATEEEIATGKPIKPQTREDCGPDCIC